MTLVKLTLPDDLARQAKDVGLLDPPAIERLIRAEIRRRRVNRMFNAADRLAALDISPLTETEVEAEIQAARAARRADARRG